MVADVSAVVCESCGEALEEGARFCEGCGRPVETGSGPDPAQSAMAGGRSAELGDGPISAPTQLTRLPSPVPEGRRPCVECGGEVMPDGYCEECGTKARRPRDHFAESPADWVAGVCDKGVRHHRNEDAMALLASEVPGERAVLIVLDGVSSSLDSDVASLAGAQAARETLRTPLPRGMGTAQSRQAAVGRVLGEATAAAHRAIVETTAPDSPNPASATFVCAVVEGPSLVHANVGDSRIYWVPDQGRPLQLSIDDSAAQQQIAAGVDRGVAESSPLAHSITKWLGRDSHDPSPRIGQLELTGPGWVLACSDGLWNYASDPAAIAEQVRSLGRGAGGGVVPAAELALALVGFANDRGGADNITAALARVEGATLAATGPVLEAATEPITASTGSPAAHQRESNG